MGVTGFGGGRADQYRRTYPGGKLASIIDAGLSSAAATASLHEPATGDPGAVLGGSPVND